MRRFDTVRRARLTSLSASSARAGRTRRGAHARSLTHSLASWQYTTTMLPVAARLARCSRLPTQPRLPAQAARVSLTPIRRYSTPQGPPRYVRFGESEGPSGGGPRNPWDMRNWDRSTTIGAALGAGAVVYYVSQYVCAHTIMSDGREYSYGGRTAKPRTSARDRAMALYGYQPKI